jgi:hypothetical protein
MNYYKLVSLLTLLLTIKCQSIENTLSSVTSTINDTLPPKLIIKTYFKIVQQICILNGNIYDFNLNSCIKSVPLRDSNNCKGEGQWIDEVDNTCKTVYNTNIDSYIDLISVYAPFAFKPDVKPELANVPTCYRTFCNNNWNEDNIQYRIVYGNKSGGFCYCEAYEPIPYCTESCDPDYYYDTEVFPPLSLYKNIEQSDFDTTAKFTLEKQSDSIRWCRCPFDIPNNTPSSITSKTISTTTIDISSTNTNTNTINTLPPKIIPETYLKVAQQICILEGNIYDSDLNSCIKSVPLSNSNNCKGEGQWIDEVDNTCKTVYNTDIDTYSDLVFLFAPFAFKPDVEPKLANIPACYGTFCYNWNEENSLGSYRIVFGNKSGGVCYCEAYEQVPYCTESCDPDYYYETEVFPPLSLYENIEQSDFDTTAKFTLEKQSDSIRWCRCPIDVPNTTTTTTSTSKTISTTTVDISSTNTNTNTINTLPPKTLPDRYLKVAQQICILEGNVYDSDLNLCIKSVPLSDSNKCKGDGQHIDEVDNTCKTEYRISIDTYNVLVSVYAPFAFKPDVEPELANVPTCYTTFCNKNWIEDNIQYRIVYGDKSGGVCYCEAYEPIPYCTESCDPDYYYDTEVFPPLSLYENIEQSDFDTTAKFTLEKRAYSYRWCRCPDVNPSSTITAITTTTYTSTITPSPTIIT